MAIARDSVSHATGVTSGTTLNWSHTCTGTNLILTAHFYIESGGTISGVTYNSVAMTQGTASATTGGVIVYSFYLINPTTGTNTISATRSTSSGLLYGIGVSYTGAKQSGQPDASNNNATASGTSISTTVTTVAANTWIVGGVYGGNASSFAGTGSFASTPVFWGTGGATSALGWNGFAVLDTNTAIVSPAATAVGMSMGGAANAMSISAFSIAPPSVAPTSGFFMAASR